MHHIRLVLLCVLVVAIAALGLLTVPRGSTAQAQAECGTHTNTWRSDIAGDDATDPAELRDQMTFFSTDGGTMWSPAYVVDREAGWATPIPGSSWISVTANKSGLTQSRYRADFTVAGPYLHSQSVTVRVHADNAVTVSRNGRVFGQQPGGNPTANFRDPPEVYTTSSGLQVGGNTLGFLVTNQGGTVTGLDYEATVQYKSCSTPPTPTPPDSAPGLG